MDPKHLVGKDNLAFGPRITQVLECYFAHPDWTQEQIAKECGVSRPRISAILKNPRVTEAFPILARRVVRSRHLAKSLKAYEEIIDQNDNLAAKEKAAARVLSDQKVFDAPEIHVKNTIEVKSTEELEALLRHQSSIPPLVIEAEVVKDPDM